MKSVKMISQAVLSAALQKGRQQWAQLFLAKTIFKMVPENHLMTVSNTLQALSGFAGCGLNARRLDKRLRMLDVSLLL